jgi:hypothetical protein
MRRPNRSVIVAAAAAVLLALAVGLVALLVTPPVEAKGGCRCPLIYAPVLCDNGKVYPNLCVAECHNGRNCVPTGEL